MCVCVGGHATPSLPPPGGSSLSSPFLFCRTCVHPLSSATSPRHASEHHPGLSWLPELPVCLSSGPGALSGSAECTSGVYLHSFLLPQIGLEAASEAGKVSDRHVSGPAAGGRSGVMWSRPGTSRLRNSSERLTPWWVPAPLRCVWDSCCPVLQLRTRFLKVHCSLRNLTPGPLETEVGKPTP